MRESIRVNRCRELNRHAFANKGQKVGNACSYPNYPWLSKIVSRKKCAFPTLRQNVVKGFRQFFVSSFWVITLTPRRR